MGYFYFILGEDLMQEKNIEFQEQYKKLDKLCREIYSSNEGVSSYIKDMENTPYVERSVINDWDIVYKELKHVRWMRNQLAHDVSIESEFCKQSDIDFVESFYASIMEGKDPLACAYKAKQVALQKQKLGHKLLTENKMKKSMPENVHYKLLWNRNVLKIFKWIFGVCSAVLSVLLITYLGIKQNDWSIIDSEGRVIINKTAGVCIIVVWAIIGALFLLFDYLYRRSLKNKS